MISLLAGARCNTLAEEIKAIRTKLSMNQVEFAQKLKITQGALSKYETNQRKPSVEFLLRLAKLAGCSVEDLLNLEGVKTIPCELRPNMHNDPSQGQRYTQGEIGQHSGERRSGINFRRDYVSLVMERIVFPVLASDRRFVAQPDCGSRELALVEGRGVGREDYWLAAHFDEVFGEGRALDIGAGSGRDILLLRKRNIDAYGVEPNKDTRKAAIKNHHELSGRLAEGYLPGAHWPFDPPFDGILCSDVLHLLQPDQIFPAAACLTILVRPGGSILVSFPWERGLPRKPMAEGDLPEGLIFLMKAFGCDCLGRWESPEALPEKQIALWFQRMA